MATWYTLPFRRNLDEKFVAGLTAPVFSSSTLVVEAATLRAAEDRRPLWSVLDAGAAGEEGASRHGKQAAKKPAKGKKKRASRAHNRKKK